MSPVVATLFGWLADAVVVLHLVVIVYGLLGGLLYYWKNWLVVPHLPLAVWISLIEFFGWTCPLTPLENTLRQAAGDAVYRSGFIEHYLLPLIYPVDLTSQLQLLLGVIALSTNLFIYTIIWRHWRRRSARG